MALHTIAIDNSTSKAPPILFLHGFGGVGAQWRGLQTALSFKVPTLAFDLPGHGKSADFPKAGPPITAVRAILAEMDKRKIEKAHFVGHSMGGAISSLTALVAPQRIASLTLLAPGGFGEEFNCPLLKKWAAAKTPKDISSVLPHFFAASYDLQQKVVDFQFGLRSQPGAVEALIKIVNDMSTNGKQGVLAVDEVLSGPYPVSVIWGDADEVLPVSQARELDGKVDLHIVEGMGHSPAEEAPELVKRIIIQNCFDCSA